MHVNAKYPESTHDSHIWNNCNVLPFMQQLFEMNKKVFLIADSSYALRPWMITPITEVNEDSPEAYYTKRQTSARSLIERVNGILKMRSRCLLKHRVLHYDPVTAAKIVKTCCVLHNMCVTDNIPLIQNVGDNDNPDEVDLGIYPPALPVEPDRIRLNPELERGRRLQNQIVQLLWNRRNQGQ